LFEFRTEGLDRIVNMKNSKSGIGNTIKSFAEGSVGFKVGG
jgi:hypothetical protein